MQSSAQNPESKEQFRGPVFIVGMPRSGTKLLRTLMNTHPSIGIPPYETEFYPYLTKALPAFGDCKELHNFKELYTTLVKLPYFIYGKRDGKLIDPEAWHAQCLSFDAPNIFRALITHDVKYQEKKLKIWGDKSPTYLLHMTLLKRDFPDARFIHIVRDVRDYCLSVNKAWGKNIYRAAQRWSDNLLAAEKTAQTLGSSYLTVRYEDLLSNPEATLRTVCQHIFLEYEPSMLKLSEAPEEIGDAKNTLQIVRTNHSKYMQHLNPATVQKIESIAGDGLIKHSYPLTSTFRRKRLNRFERFHYQYSDALNLLRTAIHRHGFTNGVRIILGFSRLRSPKAKLDK